MRTLKMYLALLCATACGGSTAGTPVSILLGSDDTHPCAGATRVRATLQEVGGEAIDSEAPAAVAPEQLDCDFAVGVAEALYGLNIADAQPGTNYLVRVVLLDSTGLTIAAGATAPFDPADHDTLDLQLTRVAPLGTVLIDLWAEASYAAVTGTLEIVALAGATPVGARSLDWPGEAPEKRPLRISGLTGIGLRLSLEVTSGGNSVVSRLTEMFSVGSSASDAFVEPALAP